MVTFFRHQHHSTVTHILTLGVDVGIRHQHVVSNVMKWFYVKNVSFLIFNETKIQTCHYQRLIFKPDIPLIIQDFWKSEVSRL